MSTRSLIPEQVPLASIPGLEPGQAAALSSFWVTTAQELAALGYHPPTRDRLAAALKLDREGLDRLLEAAQRKVPGTRALRSRQLEFETLAAYLPLGALLHDPSREITQDRPPYRPARRTALPHAVDYLDLMPASRDQGTRSTCVAHAVAALREVLEIAAGCDHSLDLSEQFLYWWCKQNDGLPDQPGTYLAIAMRGLELVGLPREEDWPYVLQSEGSEGQGPPPPAAAGGDRAFRTARTVEFNRADIDGMKLRLYEGSLLAVTFQVFESWYYSLAARRWGKITMPLPGEAPEGGHALALVGYEDDPEAPGGGYFIGRNSWTRWAYDSVWREGYACLPYAYVSQYAMDVASADRVVEADLYLRDTEPDTGRRPLANASWNSPDIWVRRAPDGLAECEPPQPGEENSLYVRLANAGPAYAYNVSVEVHAAPLAPAIRSGDWQPIARQAAARIGPGSQWVYGPLPWVPQDGSPGAYALRARVAGSGKDTGLGPVRSNDVAQRHLWFLHAAPGARLEVAFPLSEMEDCPGPVRLVVEGAGLPVEIALSGIQIEEVPEDEAARGPASWPAPPQFWSMLMKLLPLQRPKAGPRWRARLTVSVAPEAIPGGRYQFAIVQFQGTEAVGRLTCEVSVDASARRSIFPRLRPATRG